MPRALIAVLALLLALLAAALGGARAVAACSFSGGFATLHDALPDVVGACAGDVSYSGESGDATQTTTRGLLVWRKADNWTAFTNGSTTWVLGPCGLQSRPNDQRFAWEQGGACDDPVLLAAPTAESAGNGSPGAPPPAAPPPTLPPAPAPTAAATLAPTPAPTTTGTRADPLPLGATAQVTGLWTVAVVSATPDATGSILQQLPANRPPAPGEQFFLARVSITNLASVARQFGAHTRLNALGPSGQVYLSQANTCGAIPDPLTEPSLEPGGTVTGNLCWQVLSSDAGRLLLFDRTPTTVGPFFALS